MFQYSDLDKRKLESTTAMWRALRVCANRGWRGWVAAITAISFALLILAVAAHKHTTSLEDQACSICHVATQKLVSTDTSLPTAKLLVFLAYRLPTQAPISVVTISPLQLPPSCGPPILS